ncbi:hypothetical protein [Clostridium magnum]|uniref:Uncharacterized protein n=1 Tax=Clostridium magnum DSM 2767 TaxID=1121326 RepID=A0A162TPF5_9CLOT|nr:hypothetical protein [Clostridium magnum]KZL92884.1 hypothetical protein CLMAG_26980 [Clostridium magnum DSM 2767]SHI28138.1 hypothetical protein SAMN02745944_03947 [Clostridium magnum DSM 2767]
MKNSNGIYVIFKLMSDVIIAWQAYDFYKADKRNLAILLIAAYLVIRIWWFLRGIRRKRLKNEFNEIFPE